jgi:hypothetical protein
MNTKSSKTNKHQLNETQIQQLKQYAEQVNQLHTEIVSNDAISISHSKIALNLVINAGGILNKMKELVGHGKWGKWASENVTCMCPRTRTNYMKLAQKVANGQHDAVLNDVQSVRQAYKRVGIINGKTKPEQTPVEPLTPVAMEKKMTPAKVKEKHKGQYDLTWNQERQNAIIQVRLTIDAEKRVNWNLSNWTIKNNRPCSGDEANHGAALFDTLKAWVANCDFAETLTREDEINMKAGIVLTEVVKSFIGATTTTGTEVSLLTKLPANAQDYSFSVNSNAEEMTEATPA